MARHWLMIKTWLDRGAVSHYVLTKLHSAISTVLEYKVFCIPLRIRSASEEMRALCKNLLAGFYCVPMYYTQLHKLHYTAFDILLCL